jgi:reverse gyrase
MELFPVIKGKYRFLGGMKCPQELWDLRVGEGYEAEQKGRDYVIHAHKTIIISKYDFERYFEPYVDYGYEGDGRYKDYVTEAEEKRVKEIQKQLEEEHEEEKEEVLEVHEDFSSGPFSDESTAYEQLSLF